MTVSPRLEIAERSPNRLVLRQGACLQIGFAYFIAAAALAVAIKSTGSAALTRSPGPPESLLWAVCCISIGAGINRTLGTVSILDSTTGKVTLARTLGARCLYRRSVSMAEVRRLFHDQRPYLKLPVMNIRLELANGTSLNVTQWCSAGTDYEAEVALANRLLFHWKRHQALISGQQLETFGNLIGEACPKVWTMDGLASEGVSQRLRGQRCLLRAVLALILSRAVYLIGGVHLPTWLADAMATLFAVSALVSFTFAVLHLISWFLR
jgi:hypothetical protein